MGVSIAGPTCASGYALPLRRSGTLLEGKRASFTSEFNGTPVHAHWSHGDPRWQICMDRLNETGVHITVPKEERDFVGDCPFGLAPTPNGRRLLELDPPCTRPAAA